MPTKVMMYYGPWDDETMFDASRWFDSKEYRPRQMDGSPSLVTMLRTRLMPFTQDQIKDFPIIAAMALHKQYPDVDHLKLLDLDPISDLSQRVRCAYSAFSEPDQPVDYYYLYVELDGNRYVVTFDRDGQSGALRKKTYGARAIIGEYASQAEHRKAFEEIEAEERRQGRRE